MDNESQVIEKQMEETRTSLQDKLETLEQQVKNTVQDATEAVSETVESVKDAVQETVSNVKDTVQGTVESVKDTFDLAHQAQAHPWGIFLGATALGFVATRLLTRDRSGRSATAPIAPLTYQNGSPVAGNSYTSAAPTSPQAEERSSWWSWIADHYSEELNKVKGLALGTAGGVIRDMLLASASPALAEQIKEVVDGATAKLGGQVIEGPILTFDDHKDCI